MFCWFNSTNQLEKSEGQPESSGRLCPRPRCFVYPLLQADHLKGSSFLNPTPCHSLSLLQALQELPVSQLRVFISFASRLTNASSRDMCVPLRQGTNTRTGPYTACRLTTTTRRNTSLLSTSNEIQAWSLLSHFSKHILPNKCSGQRKSHVLLLREHCRNLPKNTPSHIGNYLLLFHGPVLNEDSNKFPKTR